MNLLLDKNADPHITDINNWYPLFKAIEKGLNKCAIWLLKNMTQFEEKELILGDSVLHFAVKHNNEIVVKKLVKKGL